MKGDEPLTVVGTFSSSFDAEFARSLLRSAGIETFISGDVPGGRYSIITVSVACGDEPEARQILQAGQRTGSGGSRDAMADAVQVGMMAGRDGRRDCGRLGGLDVVRCRSRGGNRNSGSGEAMAFPAREQGYGELN
jgi:hypothetical protein